MKLESQTAANTLLYITTIIIGLILMMLTRDFSHSDSNALAGFLLGCMLFGLGVLGMLIGETRTIELDERRKRIVLNVRRKVGGSKQLIILFDDIGGFGIGAQGKFSSGTRFYDLIVRLKSGKEIYLFGGCVFEGRMSREQIEGMKSFFEKTVSFQEKPRSATLS